MALAARRRVVLEATPTLRIFTFFMGSQSSLSRARFRLPMTPSKIVVNTQPPLHELWLASRRGGYHFKFVDGQWIDTKDGVAFFARLSEEASHHAGRPLVFSGT
jgi:hypothetical protein